MEGKRKLKMNNSGQGREEITREGKGSNNRVCVRKEAKSCSRKGMKEKKEIRIKKESEEMV